MAWRDRIDDLPALSACGQGNRWRTSVVPGFQLGRGIATDAPPINNPEAMAKRPWAPYPPAPVEIERDGKRYTGSYTYAVGSGVITVSCDGGGSKSAQLGGADAKSLARLLLDELVTEQLLRKGSG
jgi:hypothetical protein